MQDKYEKQLRLTAAMVERGGFKDLGPREVASFTYIGLGSGEKAMETLKGAVDLEQEWERFVTLITRYARRSTGYAARRAVMEDRVEGDYDHLARHGEWQMTDRATPEVVGEKDSA